MIININGKDYEAKENILGQYEVWADKAITLETYIGKLSFHILYYNKNATLLGGLLEKSTTVKVVNTTADIIEVEFYHDGLPKFLRLADSVDFLTPEGVFKFQTYVSLSHYGLVDHGILADDATIYGLKFKRGDSIGWEKDGTFSRTIDVETKKYGDRELTIVKKEKIYIN